MIRSPLQRIQVNDGMLITADHWQIAHSYHQQRQAIHYEALHRGGIVSGLGVRVGPMPDEAPSKYRQPRWLTIQPGLAIDAQGNPIVVSTAESCYLSAQPVAETTIYIVLKHSERSSSGEIVQEAFQILEKDVPADHDEVELCRVRMAAGEMAIATPDDVCFPGLNQLDLRHRLSVGLRSQITATVSAWSSPMGLQFEALLAVLPNLYPSLDGILIDQPLQGDLTHLSYDQFCQLSRPEQHQSAQYLQRGGVLLVEASGGQLCELYHLETELSRAIATHCQGAAMALQQSAQQELTEIQTCIADAVTELTQPLLSFLNQEGLPVPGPLPPSHLKQKEQPDPGPLPLNHPLRLQPFSFSQWPTLHGQPVGLYAWGGLVLLVGALPQAWKIKPDLSLPRDEMRGAQELGINLLHFAAQRRSMQSWLAPVS